MIMSYGFLVLAHSAIGADSASDMAAEVSMDAVSASVGFVLPLNDAGFFSTSTSTGRK